MTNLDGYINRIGEGEAILRNAGKFNGKQRIDMIYSVCLLLKQLSGDLDALANRMRQQAG